MINSISNRHSLSPFKRYSTSNSIDHDINSNSKKNNKRNSLKIITTGNGTNSHIQSSPSSSITTSSPSRVRQRLSSLFRSSSPVVTTLKETFSHNTSSQNLTSYHKNSSKLSLSKVIEEKSHQQENMLHDSPTNLKLEGRNNSTDSLCSSSDNSDHMPASPADFTTVNNGKKHPSITDSSFWQTTTIIEKPNLSIPPIPPPHKVTKQLSLADHVHEILGSTINEVDEEIDRDWEISRKVLRKSLIQSPKNSVKFYY